MNVTPGWHADPYPQTPPGQQRFWDGMAWTGDVRPAPPPSTAPGPPPVMPLARQGPPSVARPDTTTPVDHVDDLAYWGFIALLTISSLAVLPLLSSVFDAEALIAISDGNGQPPLPPLWAMLMSPLSLGAAAYLCHLDGRRNAWFVERRSSAARFLSAIFFAPVYVFLRDTNAGQGRRRFWTYMIVWAVMGLIVMGAVITQMVAFMDEMMRLTGY